MKLYHGSTEKFNEFKLDFIGKNGTSEGWGLYFSTHEEIARSYAGEEGYLYEVEVDLGGSINDNEKKFNYEMYKKFLLSIQEDTGFLDNYGDISYDGIEKVLKEATTSMYNFSDSDVEILGGLINANGGAVELLNRLYANFFNVTHIIEENAEWGKQKADHTVYVILNPKIVEIKNIKEVRQS